MQVEYTGRHVEITSKLKQQAEVVLARIGHIVDRSATAHIILTEEKYRKIAEVTVRSRGEALVGECEATDMEKALHDALHRVEQQAIRHKDRIVANRHTHAAEPELENASPGSV
jgi:putative sigma-54 modulation protein